MLSSKAFFSFTEVVDRSRHRDYNAWHQLDHRPENLALPGVLHGERWVRSPDCIAAGPSPIDALRDVHYINMYWFSEPVEESFRDWQALGERSFQWGRRPDAQIVRRPLMGSFSPVKGYVSPRVLVSPDALPFRPNRGVAIAVSRLADPHSAAAHDLFGWYDQVRIPDLLSCVGVAGAWTFASQSTTLDRGWSAASGSTTFDERSELDSGRYRILLVYLDADPLEFLSDYRRRQEEWRDAERQSLEVPILSSALRAITPWQWDWFD
ncbi:MAG: hypothetical protein QOE61_1014 [Micromonosporaceae bacterium]|jgi:hypothetical protein|nr:hypothetical protein [Micromonosporaceae bacterium]